MAIVDKYISHITPLDSPDTYKLKAYLLKNGRTFKVQLNSTNASTAFDGSADIADIGVSGILGAANGGTGNNLFTKDTLIYANTATKLASYTSTNGGAKKLWYLNAGVPTDSAETVGATDKPVFLSSGTITESNSTIGSGVIPIYMASGQIKASTSTIGSFEKPVYLNAGTITTLNPVWLLKGGTAITTDTELDLNNYLTIGNYYVASTGYADDILHTPYSNTASSTMTDGVIKVYSSLGSSADYLKQEYIQYNSGRHFVRHKQGASADWTGWRAYAFTPAGTDIAIGAGGTEQPIYVKATGELTPTDYYLKASIESGVKNRAAYYSDVRKIEDAGSIYMTASTLGVNQTSITSGQTFEVTGKAHIANTTANNGTTATPPAFSVGTLTGTNIGVSPTGIQAKNNATTSTLNLNYYGSPVVLGQPSTPANTTINGILTIDRRNYTYTTDNRGTLINLINMRYNNAGGSKYYEKTILAAIATNETDTTVDGASVFLGSQGGALVLGAGESPATVQKNNDLNSNKENIYLIADGGMLFYTNADNARHKVTIDSNGLTVEESYLRMRPYSATYNVAAADSFGSIFFNHDRENYPADTFITGNSIRAAKFIVKHDHLVGVAPTAAKTVEGIKWTDNNNVLMSRIYSYKWKNNATHHGLYFNMQSAESTSTADLFSLHADDSISDIYYISLHKRINTSLNISATAGYTANGENGAGSTLYNNGVLYLNSTVGSWTYTRLNNGTYLWDIATKSNDNTSSLQFRNNSSGSNTTYVRFDLDGSIYTGNLTIGGKINTDAGKTIISSSTLYLKTSTSSSIIFNTDSTNRARFDPSGHFKPESTNTYTLGISGTRWKSLFIGTADSYGGTTQPIWWNAGVPTAITTAIATAYGGTGNNTFTQNRLIWASEDTKLSSATNLWTNGTTIRFLKESSSSYALLQNTYNSTVYDTLLDYQNGNIVLNAASSGLYLGYSNTTYIDFIHSLGRWTSTGLGVGTTSPSYKLHIVGTGYFTDTVHINKNSGTGVVDANTAPLLIGTLSKTNLAIGNNAIQARNNGAISKLWFNYEGGEASFGSSISKTVPTTFFGTVTPGATNTYNLGTASLQWKTLNESFEASRVLFNMGTSPIAAGWRRVCKVRSYNYYTNFVISISGQYSSVRPTGALVSVNTASGNNIVLNLLSGHLGSRLTKIRLVHAGDHQYWVDIYTSAFNDGTKTFGTILFNFYGNVLVSDIQTALTTQEDNQGVELDFISTAKIKLGAELANGYWGMTTATGANNDYIRTTTVGLIPYQSGGAGDGHSTLGTSGWRFKTAYINDIYSTTVHADLNGNADTATKFSSNATVTLTGDTTGTSAGSTKSWSVPTITSALTVKGGRVATADSAHAAADYSKMYLRIATDSMTTNKPKFSIEGEAAAVHDGHILEFHWDNSGAYNEQLALSNSKPAISVRAQPNGTWSAWTPVLTSINTKWVAWGAGTTAGPTAKLNIGGTTITSAAIPSASTGASGIVTTGAQSFAGIKTFTNPETINTTGNGAAINFKFSNAPSANAIYGQNWISLTNNGGRFYWREWGGTADGRTAGYEQYCLPACDAGRTTTVTYDIITTKNMSSLITGVKSTAAGTATNKCYILGQRAAGAGTVYIATKNTSGSANKTGIYFQGSTGVLHGAAWNDYAEFRQLKENKMYAITVEPGRVVYENGDDTLSISNERLMRGCSIVSDTYGFGIGESEKAQLPIAVSGRVLAYPYENKEEFKNHIGWPVCSGPNGTVSIMTEEEEMKYPSRIIGTISAVPDYEIWHGGADVVVDGRVWIKVK